MAHEMTRSDSLILRRTAAWHGKGRVVQEDLSPMEAFKESGLNWNIVTTNRLSGYIDGDENTKAFATERFKMIVREDTGDIFAVQPSNWTPLQNHQMAEDAQLIADEIGGCAETFGSIRGGRIVYTAIGAKDGIEIGGKGDFVKPYFILCNGHDGTLAYKSMWSGIRPVCANTVRMAIDEGKKDGFAWSLKHTLNFLENREYAVRVSMAWKKATDNYAYAINNVAKKSMTAEQIRGLWVDVLETMYGEIPLNPVTKREETKKATCVAALRRMSNTFDREAGEFGANAWIAYNAVTEFIQHSELAARSAPSSDSRIHSHLFGREAELRNIAWRKTVELVGA